MVTAVAEHNPQLNWNSLPAVTTINVTEQYSGGKQSTHDTEDSQEEACRGQKLLLTSVCDVFAGGVTSTCVTRTSTVALLDTSYSIVALFVRD